MFNTFKLNVKKITTFSILFVLIAAIFAVGSIFLTKEQQVNAESGLLIVEPNKANVETNEIVPTNAEGAVFANETDKYTVVFYNGSTILDKELYPKATATALTSFVNLGGTIEYSSAGWSFAGWSKSITSYTIDYANSASIAENTTATVSLFAVYQRTVNVYSNPASASTKTTHTQYWNASGFADSNISPITAPVLSNLSGYTKQGYRHDTNANSAIYMVTDNATAIRPMVNKVNNLYGVYTQCKVFKSGKNVTGVATKYKVVGGSESNPSSADAGGSSGWTLIGLREDTTAAAPTLIYDKVVPSFATTNLYGIYTRQLYNVYVSGVNAATTVVKSVTQYLNAYQKTVSSCTFDVDIATTSSDYAKIDSWVIQGFSATQDSSISNLVQNHMTRSPAYGSSDVTSVYYAVYSRGHTVTFHSGAGLTKKDIEVNASTTYYNTMVTSIPSNIASITLLSGADERFVKINDWTAIGWRTDTTAGNAQYNLAATINGTNGSVAFSVKDFYAVYSRTLTITYDNNTGTGSMDPSTTTVYLNSNTKNASPILSSTTITLKQNTFEKAGYTFVQWLMGSATSSTKVAAGNNYTPLLNYTDSFSITAYADWKANTYTIQYYNGTNLVAEVDNIYDVEQNLLTWAKLISDHSASIIIPDKGWSFHGWAISNQTITRTYVDGQKVSNLAEQGSVAIYAMYQRTVNVSSGSGANKVSSNPIQVWNTSSQDNVNIGTITVDAPTAITNWTAEGYRQDTSASSATFMVNTSTQIRPAVNGSANLYGVYYCDYEATFYSGLNKETSKTIKAERTYYNSNTTSLPVNAKSITMGSASDCTSIPGGWNAIGWRSDELSGNKTYNFNTAYTTIPFGTIFYAIYSKDYTANFYSGPNCTPNSVQAETTYYNSAVASLPTTVSSLTIPAITSISNWVSKVWRADKTASISGTTYTTKTYTNEIPFTTTDFYAVYQREFSLNYLGNGNTSGTMAPSKLPVYMNAFNHTMSAITFDNLPTTTSYWRTGYAFEGWSETSTGSIVGSPYTTTIAYDASSFLKNLYAKWTPRSYQLTVEANGGLYNNLSSTIIAQNYGTSINLDNPTRNGYIFRGWAITKTVSSSKYVLVLYHDNQNGTSLFSASPDLKTTGVNEVAKYSNLYNLADVYASPAGYNFLIEYPQINSTKYNTWSQTSNPMTSTAITGYAPYHIDYTTNFNGLAKAASGAYASSVGKSYYAIGATQAITESQQTGIYGPTGVMSETVLLWVKQTANLDSINIDRLGENLPISPSTYYFRDFDATVTALWEARTFDITYDEDGGVSVEDQKYTVSPANQTIQLKTTTKKGYTFDGWTIETNTLDGSCSIDDTHKITIPGNANGNITLKAKWIANTYYIKYYNGPGETPIYTDTLIYDQTYTLTSWATMQATVLNSSYGWHFYGWAAGENATTSTTQAYTDAQTGITNLTDVPGASIKLYSIYERTIILKSGTTSTEVEQTQYWNTYSEADTNLSSVLLSAPIVIQNWTALGYVQHENATTATFTATTTAGAGKPVANASATLYAVYSRTVTFKSGVNSAKTDLTQTQYLNTKGLTVSAITSGFPFDIGHSFTALGYRADGTASVNVYQKDQSISPVYSTQNTLNAVYSRTITDKYCSGIKEKAVVKTATQYYNTAGNISSAKPDYVNPSSIQDWTFLGYATSIAIDSATISSVITAAVAKTPAVDSDAIVTNYYGIYYRDYTPKFHSGLESTKTTQTGALIKTYYNSNTAVVPTTVSSVAMPSDQACESIPNLAEQWEKSGWRYDTTADEKEFSFGVAYENTIPFNKTDFYAIYTRDLIIKYEGNNATKGSTPDTTKTIYLNSDSTITSDQEVILAKSGFLKIGYSFSEWMYNSNGYEAEKAFNPHLAYNASSFVIVMTASWNAQQYNLTIDPNFDGVVEDTGAGITYYDGTYEGETSVTKKYLESFTLTSTPTRQGYDFLGWAVLPKDTTFEFIEISGYGTLSNYGATSNGEIMDGINEPVSYNNPDFSIASNLNGITQYNGATISQVAAADYNSPLTHIPTTSSYMMQVISSANNSGFSMPFVNSNSKTALYAIVANLPVGTRIEATGATWSAAGNAGTGTWKLYSCTFTNASNVGNFYLSGATTNKTWYVAYANAFDATGYTLSSSPIVFTFGANHTKMVAMWAPILNTITYNVDGGSIIPASSYYVKDSAQNITIPVTTKTGYTFAGWELEEGYQGTIIQAEHRGEVAVSVTNNYNSTNTLTIPAFVCGNIKLKAKWQANAYTVSYVNGEGGGVNALTFQTGSYVNTNFVIDYDHNFAISGSFRTPAADVSSEHPAIIVTDRILSNNSYNMPNTLLLQITSDKYLNFSLFGATNEIINVNSSETVAPDAGYAYTIIYNAITKEIVLTVINNDNVVSWEDSTSKESWNGSHTFTTEEHVPENCAAQQSVTLGSVSMSCAPVTLGPVSIFSEVEGNLALTKLIEPYNLTKVRNTVNAQTIDITKNRNTVEFTTIIGKTLGIAIFGQTMPKISIPIRQNEDMFNGYYSEVDANYKPTTDDIYITSDNTSERIYNTDGSETIYASWKPSFASLQYYSKSYYANLEDAFTAAHEIPTEGSPLLIITTLRPVQNVSKAIVIDTDRNIRLTSKMETTIQPSVEEGREFDGANNENLFIVNYNANFEIVGGSSTNTLTIKGTATEESRNANITSSLIVVNGNLTLSANAILTSNPLGSGSCGAGVYVGENIPDTAPVLNINGATITGLHASNGAGVYLNIGTVNFSAGTISNNTATEKGSGIYVSNGCALNISGTASIQGNNIPATNFDSFKSSAIYTEGNVVLSGGSITSNGTNSSALAIQINGGSFTNGVSKTQASSIVYNGASISNGIDLISGELKLIGGTLASNVANARGTIKIGGAPTLTNATFTKTETLNGFVQVLDDLSTVTGKIALKGTQTTLYEDTAFVKFAKSVTVADYLNKFTINDGYSLYADQSRQEIKVAKNYTLSFTQSQFSGKHVSNLNVVRTTSKTTSTQTTFILNSTVPSGISSTTSDSIIIINGLFKNDVITVSYSTDDGYQSELTIINNGIISKPTSGCSVTVNGDVTVSVAVNANTYYVAFNKNFTVDQDGDGINDLTDIKETMANQVFTYGQSAPLSKAFERDGYSFKGWATTTGTTTVAYNDEQSVSNLTKVDGATVTLYAVWEKITYNLKLIADNGAVISVKKGSSSSKTPGYTNYSGTTVQTDDRLDLSFSVEDEHNATLYLIYIGDSSNPCYTTAHTISTTFHTTSQVKANLITNGNEFVVYAKAVMNLPIELITAGHTRNENTKTVTLTSFNYDDPAVESIDLVIPSTVSFDGNQMIRGDEYRIIAIGDNAFKNKTKLTSVVIPNTVISIGKNAFDSCNNLTSLTLSNNLLVIDSYAFYNCEKLESVTIPGNVSTIDTHAFMECPSLTTITFSGNPDVDSVTFSDIATFDVKYRTLTIKDETMAQTIEYPASGITSSTYGNVLNQVNTIYSTTELVKASVADQFVKINSDKDGYSKYVVKSYHEGNTLYIYDNNYFNNESSVLNSYSFINVYKALNTDQKTKLTNAGFVKADTPNEGFAETYFMPYYLDGEALYIYDITTFISEITGLGYFGALDYLENNSISYVYFNKDKDNENVSFGGKLIKVPESGPALYPYKYRVNN